TWSVLSGLDCVVCLFRAGCTCSCYLFLGPSAGPDPLGHVALTERCFRSAVQRFRITDWMDSNRRRCDLVNISKGFSSSTSLICVFVRRMSEVTALCVACGVHGAPDGELCRW